MNLLTNLTRTMSRPLTPLAESIFPTDKPELAAFFMAHSQSLSGHDFDGKKVSFYFPRTPRLADLEASYQNNGTVGIRDYTAAMDTLWDIIRKHREAP